LRLKRKLYGAKTQPWSLTQRMISRRLPVTHPPITDNSWRQCCKIETVTGYTLQAFYVSITPVMLYSLLWMSNDWPTIFFFLFFLSGNAVLQLHADVYTFYSIVAMLLCVVLFAPW